jgi:hypothetical protein
MRELVGQPGQQHDGTDGSTRSTEMMEMMGQPGQQHGGTDGKTFPHVVDLVDPSVPSFLLTWLTHQFPHLC